MNPISISVKICLIILLLDKKIQNEIAYISLKCDWLKGAAYPGQVATPYGLVREET